MRNAPGTSRNGGTSPDAHAAGLSGREKIAWNGILLLAFLYFVTLLSSRIFVIPPEILAPVWLPAGVLLAGLLRLPRSSFVPGILAAFLASILGTWLTRVPLLASVAFSLANCVVGVLGTLLLRHRTEAGPRTTILRLANLLVFGVLVANGAGATFGASVASAFGFATFGEAWIFWFLSNAWGILLVVPLAAEWRSLQRFFSTVIFRSWIELSAIAASLAVVVTLIWKSHGSGHTYVFIAPFLIFPLLVWMALRFGTSGATLASVVVTAVTLITTVHGFGRFALAYESLHTRFVELQVFMVMATLCGLVTAAVMADRERAEESLRYVSAMVESSDAAIVGKTLSGTITSWNSGAERLYGYSAAEAIGNQIQLIVPDDLLAELSSVMERLRRGEQIADLETMRRRKDGLLIQVALRLSPIRDKRGEVVGVSTISQDITDRKRAEAVLQQTRERLELSFDAAQMGSWDWDLQTGELAWYGRQESHFGFPSGTFNNRIETATARIHPDDRARVEREIRVWAAEKRRDYVQEFRVVWPDGSDHWLFAKGRIFYEDGTPKRCIGINLDITDRKLAERALQQTEERLARTQELSPIMPLHVSLAGEWLKVPPRFCDFLGYEHDELIGMPFQNVTHPDDFWADWNQCQRLIRGEIDSFELEKRFIRKDGSIRWGYINCSVVKDEAANPVHFLTYVRDINHEKRADEALRESEEALRTVVDSVYDGILLHRPDGTIVEVNERFLRMYGVERSDLAGLTIRDLSSPSTPVDSLDQIWERVQTGDSQLFEWKARRPRDGSEFDVEVYLRRVRFKGEDVILANVRDISQRKAAEFALRESEQRFRTIFDNAAVGMAQVGLDGRWIRVNERLCEIVGYSRAELESKTLQDITHPDDLHPDLVNAHKLLRGEIESYAMEKRYVHKEGHDVWVNLSAALYRDSNESPAHYIVAVEDITERKQAQEALLKSEQRFRTLSEALPQLVWTADRTGYIDYVNQRWLNHTGQELEDSLGAGSFAMVHPDDLPEVARQWNNAITTGTQHQTEFRLRGKDGQYRWHLGRGVPLRNDSGDIERWFGTCTDIHELKLAQEALVRSEKLASVGRMAMTIAHEINNPLAAVMNTLFLVRTESALPKSVLNYLDLADSELKRISHITRQALGFYRESTTPAPTSIHEVLGSVTDLLKSKIKAKHVQINKEFGDDVQITAVSGELRQVFSNLISNAIDALDGNGRIWLRVSKARDFEDRPTVRVIVADNGRGIPPEALPRIFEPFFTTKDAVGTGLGLWVSKQIIDKHRGCVRVRSCSRNEHRGTVFSVILPLTPDAEAINCPPAPVALAG